MYAMRLKLQDGFMQESDSGKFISPAMHAQPLDVISQFTDLGMTMKGGDPSADMTLSEGSSLGGFSKESLQSDELPSNDASAEGGSTPMTTYTGETVSTVNDIYCPFSIIRVGHKEAL